MLRVFAPVPPPSQPSPKSGKEQVRGINPSSGISPSPAGGWQGWGLAR